MKITEAAFLATIGAAFVDVVSAVPLRSLFKRDGAAADEQSRSEPDAVAAASAPAGDVGAGEGLLPEEEGRRELQCVRASLDQKWHPQYSQGWAQGYCLFAKDCNSPGYSTELACCNGAYRGQTSGFCLSQLPAPPTMSPTGSGGLDVYYPDYSNSWANAYCINTRPLPSGRPTYTTMLECCKGAYGGQQSGTCLSMLPSPPTTSPTGSGGLDVYYPDYSTNWADAYCINTRPLPNGRPAYTTMLECCKGAYGGQQSGKCLSMLPSPPTTSPTGSGGADFWYPRYEEPFDVAGCSNQLPLPYNNKNDRPRYDTQLACCKAAYASQTSGTCLSQLPSPPTTSPTGSGGADFWYPRYEDQFNVAGCSNQLPLPYNNKNDRPSYDTQLACCKAEYATQISGACLSQLPSPPTASPTASGGLSVYYPDRDAPYASATCINTRPLPSGRTAYSDQKSCCTAAYGSQSTHACQCAANVCYSCLCTGDQSGCPTTGPTALDCSTSAPTPKPTSAR